MHFSPFSAYFALHYPLKIGKIDKKVLKSKSLLLFIYWIISRWVEIHCLPSSDRASTASNRFLGYFNHNIAPEHTHWFKAPLRPNGWSTVNFQRLFRKRASSGCFPESMALLSNRFRNSNFSVIINPTNCITCDLWNSQAGIHICPQAVAFRHIYKQQTH